MLNMGTKAQISWESKFKNLYAIKPGTKKVKTNAVKTAISRETNATAINSKNITANQYLSKIAVQTISVLTVFTNHQPT